MPTSKSTTAIYIVVCCLVGNVLWQAFTDRDFMTAVERSWFQAWAVMFYYVVTVRQSKP